ncbi:hypothetical protein Tco_0005965 [Tanacetum coccineum]
MYSDDASKFFAHRCQGLEDLALYDNESWNDPMDFAKMVKAIAFPQDVPMVLMTLSIAWKISEQAFVKYASSRTDKEGGLCFIETPYLEMQFSNETLHEKDSNSELRAIKGQFEHFIQSKMFELSKYNTNAREILQDFNAYTTMEAQTFKETIIQNMDSIAQCMVERANHEQELKMTLKRFNES